MGSIDFAALAERLDLDLDQVLEVVAMGTALPVAGDALTTRILSSVAQLERSRAQRARPETEAELKWSEQYAERWSA